MPKTKILFKTVLFMLLVMALASMTQFAVFASDLTAINEPADGSAINEPLEGEPLINEPVDGEPLINEPAINEPADGEPLNNEPAINEPLDGEPAINEPADGKPLNNDSDVAELPAEETITPAPAAEEAPAEFAAPLPAAQLNTTDHIQYLDIKGGLFRPSAPLTRGEAARMFYALLASKPDGVPSLYADLEGTDFYYEANGLSALGIMDGFEGKFQPFEPITRAGFAAALRRFYPDEYITSDIVFTDVPYDFWAGDSIVFVTEKGWMHKDEDGNFYPSEPVTRAQAASIMNIILGRGSDRAAIDSENWTFALSDVPPSHWAFYDILEAAIRHDYTKQENGAEQWTDWDSPQAALSPGFHSINGELYYINDQGQMLRSASYGSWYFDENGRYTTQNQELDRILTDIVNKVTNDTMTNWDKRVALYQYVRGNYSYLKRAHVAKGTQGWESGYALTFFQTGRGNCFSFAGGYGLLLRKIGYNVNIIVGNVGRAGSPHGWVEILENGSVRIDDPELDMSYLKKGQRLGFLNFTYSTAPFAYRK
ncbi:MAG: S-layer homology domain-containing protein [Clostridiales bacterium]|jgi:hypothetical protein|nr:S-layer homology domain-containing protein [Clostridiales bacterium]